MTDEEIHNIYLHMSGKAEGLVEANGTADFPVLFARAILEYEGLTKEYERGFIDGMQKQMQSSVDKAVNAMTRPTYHIPSKDQREWVGLTEEDLKLLSAEWRIVYGAWMDDFARAIEAKLKDKNNG